MATLQRLAPAGFHILTKAEVMNMITALGGELVTGGYDCGGAMKEAGLINWASPNTEATDSSGFSGVGSGVRDAAGAFDDLLLNGCIWVFDEDNPEVFTFMRLDNTSGLLSFLTSEVEYAGVDLDKFGLSVRCAMDVPGDYVEGTTVMEDADGNVYDLVQIQSEEVPFTINYAPIYNWYAATDERLICADGWSVMSAADWDALITYLGGTSVAGGKLKETGLEYWNAPNEGATNEFSFNSRAVGCRGADGVFFGIKEQHWFITSENFSSSNTINYQTFSDVGSIFQGYDSKIIGGSIRIFRSATELELLLPDGPIEAKYTGNDLKEYGCTKINDKIYISDNLCETKFRNGDWIPGFDAGVYTPISNAAWVALASAGACFYNDVPSNGWIGNPAINVVVTKQNLATTVYNDLSPISLKQLTADWIADTVGAYCAYPNADILQEVDTSQTESALVVYGSRDCKRWFPVAGTKNIRDWVEQLTTSPKSGVYKYYIVVFAGRIELCELKNIDMVFGERYNNRLR